MKKPANKLLWALVAIGGMAGANLTAQPLGAKGFHFAMSGKRNEALTCYLRALDQAKKQDNVGQQARYNLAVAHLFLMDEDAEKARGYLENAVRLYQMENHEQGNALCLLEQAKVHTLAGNTDSAGICLDQGRTIFEKTKNKRGLALAANEIGAWLLAKGDWRNARLQFAEASKMNEKAKNFKAQAANLCNMGKTCIEEKNYSQAADWFLRAVGIDERYSNLAGKSVALLHLAHAFSMQNECAKARFYLERAQGLGISAFLQEEANQIRENCGQP